MWLKILFWSLVTFLVYTFVMAGLGFWQFYNIGNHGLLWPMLIAYVGLFCLVVVAAIKFLYFTKIEIIALKDKITKVVNDTVDYFKDLSTKPMELIKVVTKILKALKK